MMSCGCVFDSQCMYPLIIAGAVRPIASGDNQGKRAAWKIKLTRPFHRFLNYCKG